VSRKRCSKRKRSNRRASHGGPSHQPTNQERLVQLLEWFLADDSIFAKLKFHGNTKWLPRSLVCLALFWSWSEHRHLTDAFIEAVDYSEKISGVSAVGTYQGFMGALATWSSALIDVLCRSEASFGASGSGFRLRLTDRGPRSPGQRPMRTPSVPPTMERERPPSIERRSPKACDASGISRASRSPKCHKSG
jgi:hypothetical protein